MIEDKDFEELIKDLQRKIEYEEEAIYSETVISEYRNPTNFGTIKNPDAVGEIKGPCGDSMKITFTIENGIIREACFWTDGCGATMASGNMLMKMITGKTIEEAYSISDDDLLKVLDGLPDEHLHCSKLAVDTLHKTLEKYRKKN